MKKKDKNKEKVHVKRWGVGKTIAVIISSLAFIVGMAILGIYLGGGLNKQDQILPNNISFDQSKNPDYNSDNNTLEIASKTFELTITSTTQDITSKKVNLGFSYTSIFNDFELDYVDGTTITTDNEKGTISNGVITIPQTVEIGVPFTVTANTKNYTFANGESIQDWITGGISVVTATAKLDSGVPYTISLRIAVDTPVYKTETILIDVNGDEIKADANDVVNVVEEEYFYAKTEFYPYESRYVFCNKEEEKTSFYQLGGVQNDTNVSASYTSGESVEFYAGTLFTGGIVESFTAKDSKTYKTIKQAVLDKGYEETNFANIYNEYIRQFSTFGQENPDAVLTNITKFDIVQADIKSFTVSKQNQKFVLYDRIPLNIFINKNEQEEDSEYLGVTVTSQNGNTLNNVLENVVLSFKLGDTDIDPTQEDAFIKVNGGEVEKVEINGVTYYKAVFEENQTNKNFGCWELELTDETKINQIIKINVGLLKEGVDDYTLFSDSDQTPILYTINLETQQYTEEPIAWAEGVANSNIEGELIYESETSTKPKPAEIDLSGKVVIPEKNYFKTVQYFAYFDGLAEEEAKAEAVKLFGANALTSFAGIYENSQYLIPIEVFNDILKVNESGEFKLYFATIEDGKYQDGKFVVAQMVDDPINITVTKPLYASSVNSAKVLYAVKDVETPENTNYVEITETKYLPTKTDAQKQKIKIEFSVNDDSRQVFYDKFNLLDEFGQRLIQLKIYSNEIVNDEDRTKYDITDYFTEFNIDTSRIIDEGILSFELTADPNYTTQEELEIACVGLKYQNLNWDFKKVYGIGGKIVLYTPTASIVDFESENENLFNHPVTVNMDLNNLVDNGNNENYDNTIIVEGSEPITEVAEFKKLYSIVVIDQHGNSETLKNSWYFKSLNSDGIEENGVLTISKDKQDYSFTQSGNAKLVVCSGNVQSKEGISFDITIKGITKITIDKSNDPNNSSPNEEIYSSSDEIINIMPESATVEKYGMKETGIYLNKLIKFYVGETEDQEYTNVSYKFDHTYNVSVLGDIITVEYDESNSISKLTINNNFNKDHKITFVITDATGAVNFTLYLIIKANSSVSASDRMEGLANEELTINSSITYTYTKKSTDGTTDEKNFPTSLTSGRYASGTYYVVPQENSNLYILKKNNPDAEEDIISKAVGELTGGKIKFYHFVKDEEKSFTVIFQPEAENQYATSYQITFNISRNLELDQLKNEVSAFESKGIDLATFASIKESDGSEASNITSTYALPEGTTNYLTKSSDGFVIANNIRFGYGQSKLAQTVNVTVTNSNNHNDNTTFTFTINIVLPDGFYNNLANSFNANTDSEGEPLTPSHQIAGTNEYSYLVFEKGKKYYYDTISLDDTDYTIAPTYEDKVANINLNPYYTINLGIAITYTNNTNNLLLGFENDKIYTYIEFSFEGKKVYVAVPTIISQIGTTFVNYDGKAPEYSLKYSLMSVDQLYTSQIYNLISAGEEQEISNIINTKNASTITINENSISSSTGIISLPSSLFKGYDSNYIYVNNLSNDYENFAYLGVSITLKTANAEKTFSYLFKVNSNVEVGEPNYPYNGDAEYLEITSDNGKPISEDNPKKVTLELDKVFGQDTLKNGENRFNINTMTGENVTDLVFEDTISYVKVSGVQGNLTTPEQWNTYIQFNSISTENGQTVIKYDLKTPNKLEFIVIRNYCGGTGNDQLSVVGGVISYKFILNDIRNYSVEVYKGDEYQNEVNKNGTYDWNINNWNQSTSTTTISATGESRTDGISFYLIDGDGTKQYNLMQFNLNDQDGWNIITNEDGTISAKNNASLIFTFKYISSKIKEDNFAVTYPEYLDKDYSFVGTLYAPTGKIATINFTFKADAQFNEGIKKHLGGQDVALSDIFTIKTSKGSTITNFSCEVVESDIKDFIQISGNELQLASVLTEVQGYITFKVTWVDNGENREYTFTINDFKITPNLTPSSEQTINNIIAGQEVENTLLGELKSNYSDITYSWNINSTYGNAIAQESMSATDASSFKIKTLQVASTTTVNINVTIKATPNYAIALENGASPTYTEKVIVVTLIIEPSLKLTANYPQPNSEVLEKEYIENETTFTDFERDFLNSSAVFATASRVSVEYAKLDIDSNKIIYTSETNGIEIQSKRVTISSLENAIVEQNGKSLTLNSEIVLTGAPITFKRGSGGAGKVTLTISYDNVVKDYYIEILDSVFSISINKATNNANASSNEYETIYVDKTNAKGLFAKNRMLKTTVSSGASSGDYYVFLQEKENSENVQISNVLNLSSSFIDNNKGKTVYLDLGLTDLDSIEKYNIYVWNDANYQLAESNITAVENKVKAIFDYLITNKLSEDKFSSLFVTDSAILTSRIVLSYYDKEIAYDKYINALTYGSDEKLTDFEINANSESLGQEQTLSGFEFTFSNGSNKETKSFTETYIYMADIDIQVSYLAENNGSVTFVVKDPKNMVEAFNITRKSTNELIQKDEMISSGASFTLTSSDNDVGSNNLKYLMISAKTSNLNTNIVYDYEITANGASNDGNYVNLNLVYKIGNFEKTFALRAYVVSDYEIYHGSATQTTYKEEGKFISNINSPLQIKEENISSENNEIYEDIVIAGTNEDAYLSVVHANDRISERSVSAFNYTLEEKVTIEDKTYNIENNVTSKLNFGQNLEQNDWTKTSNVWKWNKGTNTDLILQGVKIVNFGTQYYRLVAEDGYGYKFYVYFEIISSDGSEPSIANNNLNLTEGEEVAFGAQYTLLKVEPGESSTSGDVTTTKLNINASTVEPDAFSGNDAGKQVIKIQNLQAWGFDNDYAGDAKYFSINNSNNKYKLYEDDNTIYSLANAEQDEKYLSLPNFKDVTIDSITYYYNGVNVGGKTDYTNGISSSNNLVHVNKDIYKTPSSCKITLPTIDSDKTWIYGAGNSVALTMVVSLKYNKDSTGSNIEYFEMSKTITLSKTSQISPIYTEISDNTTFDIADYIKVTDSTAATTDNEITGYTIYDDTLAVAVQGLKYETFALYDVSNINSYENQTKIDLTSNFAVGDTIVIDNKPEKATISYNGKEVTSYFKYVDGVNELNVSLLDTTNGPITLAKAQLVEVDNGGNNYEKLYYISISEKFGSVLTSGTFKIKDISGYGTFYYGNQEVGSDPFAITSITQDAVRVSSFKDLKYDNNSSSKEAQYYVISWGKENNKKSYRYSHTFNVSGTFKSIETHYDDYNYTLPKVYNCEIPVYTWAENITYSQVENGIVASGKPFTNYNGNNLYFVITSDSGTGGTGLATIDNKTGAITLKEGFDENHYATVEIYQKVSGIDGTYNQIDDVSQMKKMAIISLALGEQTVYEKTSGVQFALSDIGVLAGKELYENSTVNITLPANTSATLVSKNGDVAINQKRLENSSREEKVLQLTISEILGNQILTNISNLTLELIDIVGNSEGIDFTITNSQIVSSDGQFNQNINLSADLSTETTLTVPIGTKSIVIYNGENLLNTITLENETTSEESKSYTYQALLGESGYNGRFITIKYLNEEGLVITNEDTEIVQIIDLIDNAGKISLTIPANTAFTLNIKDENGDIVNSIAIENSTGAEMVKEISYIDLLKVSEEENLNILNISLTLSDIVGNETGITLGTIIWNSISQETLIINDWGENEEFRYVSKTYYEKTDNGDGPYTLTPVIVYYKILKQTI